MGRRKSLSEVGRGSACQVHEILLLGLGGNWMRFQGSNLSCPTHQGAGSTQGHGDSGVFVFIPTTAGQPISQLTLTKSVSHGRKENCLRNCLCWGQVAGCSLLQPDPSTPGFCGRLSHQKFWNELPQLFKGHLGAREMAPWLRALAVLAENPGLIPSSMWFLTTRSRAWELLFWPLKATGMYTHKTK